MKYVFINSISKRNIQIICFLFWICLVVVMFFNRDIYNNFTYGAFGISEWLINYQGGFVRRGICGELIYQLYHIHPFDVISFIKGVDAASSILLLILLLDIFKREGWSLAILPLPCCLYYNFQMVWARKDCILLLLAFFVFYTFRRGALSKSIRWFLLSSVLASFAILIHEAFFFYSIPILFVWYFHKLYSKDRSNLLCDVLYSLLPFVPSIIALFLVTINKGDYTTSQNIWLSWKDTIASYPYGSQDIATYLGHYGVSAQTGIDALTWQLLDTIKFHLGVNFHGYSFALIIWMLLVSFIFTNNLNTVHISLWTIKGTGGGMSGVLFLQFLFLLPMFCILSCDWGRTIPYWILSSMMFYHVFGEMRILPIPKILFQSGKKINHIFANPLIYIAIVLLVPYKDYYAPSYHDLPIVRIGSFFYHFFI